MYPQRSLQLLFVLPKPDDAPQSMTWFVDLMHEEAKKANPT